MARPWNVDPVWNHADRVLETERRRQWIQAGAVGAAAAALVLATLGWWISYVHNRDYLKEVKAKFEEVKKQVATLRGGARSDLSLGLSVSST